MCCEVGLVCHSAIERVRGKVGVVSWLRDEESMDPGFFCWIQEWMDLLRWLMYRQVE